MKFTLLIAFCLSMLSTSFASVHTSTTYPFAKSNYSFTIDWTVGPLRGPSKLLLKSWNNDQGTISGPYQDLPNQLKVYIWMPTMGHGSTPVTIKKVNAGEYEVSAINFIMGGKWQVFFQLLDGGVIRDEAVTVLTL